MIGNSPPFFVKMVFNILDNPDQEEIGYGNRFQKRGKVVSGNQNSDPGKRTFEIPVSRGGRSFTAHRCPWVALGWRFSDERQCLASFLALEAAEVVAGVKPANLFRIPNKTQPCGRNLYHLWCQHGRQILGETSLEVKELRQCKSSILLLVYDSPLLERRLNTRSARTFFRRIGYRDFAKLDQCLGQLCDRMHAVGIPHEIGVFLGYPLKDVEAFLGFRELPFTCQRLWKIFGNPRRSMELADRFAACRATMAGKLLNGSCPRAILTCRP